MPEREHFRLSDLVDRSKTRAAGGLPLIPTTSKRNLRIGTKETLEAGQPLCLGTPPYHS